MSLSIEFYPEARDDLRDLHPEARRRVLKSLDRLESEGLSLPEVGRWADNDGRMIFRLKIKEKDEEVDHRAFFDVEDGSAVIYGIFHRDEAYENSVEEEITERLP